MMTYASLQLAALASRLLPRRTAYAVARGLGRCAYRRRTPPRAALRQNLANVLSGRGAAPSEEEIDRLARAVYANFGKYLVDFFQMNRLDDATLDALVEWEHPEYLDACLRQGRGVLGLTAHIGNWELGGITMARRGYPVNAVVLPQPTERLDAFFRAWRTGRGIRPLLRGNARADMVACLKRGEIVAVLGDLDFGRAPLQVPFFGKPSRLPRGPAVLAARTGAPILPAFVLRRPDDTFGCRFYPPIEPAARGGGGEIQRRIAALLEEVIAAHPDQWFAFRPVW